MFLLSVLAFTFLGIGLGTITGLIPGIHPNLIATLFLGFSFGDPYLVSVLIIATAVTHSFLDYIPSIYLGAPEPATALSILPGHRMLLEGRGHEAVRLTVIGGVAALFTTLSLLPLATWIIPPIYGAIRPHIHWLLIGVVVYVLFKDPKRCWGIVVFGLSAAFGYLILTKGYMGSSKGLFPMLTGLFGLSMLLNSIRENVSLPEQIQSIEPVGMREAITGGVFGSVAGVLAGLLPGIGSAQAAFLAQEASGKAEDKRVAERKFLITIGGINTADAIFSLFALWVIGNPRSGAAVAVGELLGELGFGDVLLFMGVIAIASGVGAVLTLTLSKRCLRLFQRLNYKKLCLSIIGLLVVLLLVLSGVKGLLIALLGSAISMVAILSGAKKSYLMGCLVFPTILFFAGVWI